MEGRKWKLVLCCFLISMVFVSVGSGLPTYAEKEADQSKTEVSAKKTTRLIGAYKSHQVKDGEVTIETTIGDIIKVTFIRDDIFRIYLDPSEKFADGTNNKIVQSLADKPVIQVDESTTQLEIKSTKAIVKIAKDNMLFSAYDAQDKLLWQESEPLTHNSSGTTQTLKTLENEDFFGGGMQNGYFSHKNKTLQIQYGGGWNDGGRPSPAPFYMSSNGYGVFRNTFKTGQYSFNEEATFKHNENRFEAYYFTGNLQEVMEQYITVTGKPALLPRWAIGMGIADAFNTDSPSYGAAERKDHIKTMDALKIVNKYNEKGLPASFILPNDGYGCNYDVDLTEFNQAIELYGYKFGLWTDRALGKLDEEVSKGVSVYKQDVAWVGPGYEFGLDAAKTTYDGLAKGNPRPYIWTVNGWSGTSKYATPWTGDQAGSWEYIRFHIPTYIGSGLSGLPYATSDIDGIHGGSEKTYVRDMQWKAFTPVALAMSGWSDYYKEPWSFDEENTVSGNPGNKNDPAIDSTAINKKYLDLQERLVPHIYTLSEEAHRTGAPIVRAMVWEFPEDPYASKKGTEYQFMLGRQLLVAPVYEDTVTRDTIYLPKGTEWIDYWTGEHFSGEESGKVMNGYNAPLDKLPVLAKAGAIVPMYPNSTYEKKNSDFLKNHPDVDDTTGDYTTRVRHVPDETYPISFDIYPAGKSNYTLYEDDGVSQDFEAGASAKTKITSTAPALGELGEGIINVEATKGTYEGINEKRKNEFVIHSTIDPATVTLNDASLGKITKEAYNEGTTGWYFDKEERGGLVKIKTDALSIRQATSIKLEKVQHKEEPKDTTGIVKPIVPENFATSDILDKSLKLQWNKVANADSYDLMVDGVYYENHVTTTFSHQDLTELTEHAYQVRARNLAGVSEWTTELKVTTSEDLFKDIVPISDMSAVASSFNGGDTATKAIDGDVTSMWHSTWHTGLLPQDIAVSFNKEYTIDKIEYVPRIDAGNGTALRINLWASKDGKNYQLIRENVKFERNDKGKMIEFPAMTMKSFKIEYLESVGNFASAAEIRPYIAKYVPGDVNGDGVVNDDDIYNITTYFGRTKDDPSWEAQYQSLDFNKNGIVDAFDGAYVSSKIDNPILFTTQDVFGKISYTVDKKSAKTGEKITLTLNGQEFNNVYGFDAMIQFAKESYANPVIAASTSTNQMNLAPKVNMDGATVESVYPGFFFKGRATTLNGDHQLATITVTALKDIEDIGASFDLLNTRVVGANIMMTERDAHTKEMVNVTGISFEKDYLRINQTETSQLAVKYEPSETTNKLVNYVSSKPEVATVDKYGKVTGVGDGTTSIIATSLDGSHKAEAKVTVNLGEESLIPKNTLTASGVFQAGAGPEKIFDGNYDAESHWHSPWDNTKFPPPYDLEINFGTGEELISRLEFALRNTGSNGFITKYELYNGSISAENKISEGTWAKDSRFKTVKLDPPVKVNKIIFRAVEGINNNAAISELDIYRKNDLSIVKHDFEELKWMIERAGKLTETDYTAESWQVLQASVTSGAELLENDLATQEEIDAGALVVRAGITQLETVTQGDKTNLLAKIAEAEALTEEEYTAASWLILDAALTSGKEVAANEKVPQATIDAACAELQKAIEELIGISEDIPVTKIELDANALVILKKGKQQQINPVISPPEATDKTVKWTVEKESIATISESGMLIAKARGITKVTATTENGKTVSFTLRVTI